MTDSLLLVVLICIAIFVVTIFLGICKFFCSIRNPDFVMAIDHNGRHILVERAVVENQILNRDYFGEESDEKPYDMISNEDETKLCIICLEPIGENECRLKCNHGYHFNCIREWVYVNQNNNCPQCRSSLIEYQV